MNKLFVNCDSCCQAVAKLSSCCQIVNNATTTWVNHSVGKWHRLVHWKYYCILFLALQPKLFLFLCLLKVWQILRLLSRQLKVREHFAFLLRLEIFVRGQNVCWFEWMISVDFTKGHRFGILAWYCLVLLQKPVYTSFVESWCRADANEQTIYIHPRVYILYPRVYICPKIGIIHKRQSTQDPKLTTTCCVWWICILITNSWNFRYEEWASGNHLIFFVTLKNMAIWLCKFIQRSFQSL